MRGQGAAQAVLGRLLRGWADAGPQLSSGVVGHASSAVWGGQLRACSSSPGVHGVLGLLKRDSTARFGGQLRASQESAPSGAPWLPGARAFLRQLSGSAAIPLAQGAAAASTAARPAALSFGSVALSAGLPDGARRQLAWWLGGTAVWVYSMVVLGGITRLTRSGLSMTEWKFTGERPPMTDADWAVQYGKYCASPEFKKVHMSMSVEEFKFIFWMEYAHRMWGRLLGLGFVIPGAYFLARGFINRPLAKRLGLLFAMGGTQGLVGWWMVRSGLQEPQAEGAIPRVSPYRLAAHLVSAFTIYSVLVWTTLDLVQPRPLLAAASGAVAAAGRVARARLLPFAALVAVTATSGAFVAGMDGGRAFNTYPLMGGRWVPEGYWADALPGLRSLFEHTPAVQFDHRVLAATTAASALALWGVVRASAAPAAAKRGMDLVLAVTAVQFGLGIWTLLEYVPMPLGSAHQANALNLFTAVLLTLHCVRPVVPGPVSAALARFGAPVAAAAVATVGFAVTSQH